MTRAEINAIGTMVAGLRDQGEGMVAISFAAHAGSSDTPAGSISATVTMGGLSATSEAVSLADALALARAKLAREVTASNAKKAEGAA